jgi:hypothetical protein
MGIRDIQLRKAAEIRKATEKALAAGKPIEDVLGEQDPSKMTESEIYSK